MKFVKGISLFFIYPLCMFGLGMIVGVIGYDYFYPGKNIVLQDSSPHIITEPVERFDTAINQGEATESKSDFVETIREEGVLNSDTEYVLQEMDTGSGTLVEYTYSLPNKYLGMNRESFVEAMDAYEAAPPLKEVERGLTGVEVVSFSPEKVVVQMNYAFVEPTENFYVCVEENYVVVYLEDKETVYMHTDILLENLPENVQIQIMTCMYVKGEEDLYHFLETYSS